MKDVDVRGVILAGGVGSRFWPLSRVERPKQFLQLFGDKTLLAATASRLSGRIAASNWMVVTNQQYVPLVKESLPDIPNAGIIGEPVARNTAPCIALATAMVAKDNPDAVVVTLPSDHHITDTPAYRRIMDAAIKAAATHDALVTIGIRPDRPETGYGYIQFGDSTGEEGNEGEMDGQAREVVRFREKPDVQTALSFLKDGHYLWNSGMFIWRASVFLNELRHCMPDLYESVEPFTREQATEDRINRFFQEAESISIDYGLMEKAHRVQVVPGVFGWNDVGSWQAIHDLGASDKAGNTGELNSVVALDASNNHVHITTPGKLIALVGVEGLAVVETDDALLICPLDRAQDVKKVVDTLGGDSRLQRYK